MTDEVEVKSSPPPAPGPAATKSKKKPEKKAKEKDTFKHPWLVTSLKVQLDLYSVCAEDLFHFQGHSGRVMDLDICPNGRHLATCAEDQTVMVWSTK